MSLHTACIDHRRGWEACQLLCRGADPDELNGVCGWAPVHFACGGGSLQALEGLIAAGANLNAQTGEGDTAAHFASKFRNLPTFLMMLAESGADLTIANAVGETIRDVASKSSTRILSQLRRAEQFALLVGPPHWLNGDLGLPAAVAREVLLWC